jgi:RNA-binding protein NOB1
MNYPVGKPSESTQSQNKENFQINHKSINETDPTTVKQSHIELDEMNSDFEGEWITPSKLEKQKKTQINVFSPNDSFVGCISSDFAVQNVLLQLKLRLYSLDGGKRITMIKNWLLRCHACYWTTLDNQKKFCGKCGGLTLTKTSYRVDASGKRELFLRDDYQYNLRGTKYSLPKVQTGRGAQNLILREDQIEYQRGLKHKAKQEKKLEKDPSGALEDYLEKKFGSAMRGLGSTSDGYKGNFQAGNIQIGYGKKNPNEKRKKY